MSSFAQKWENAGELLRSLDAHGKREVRPGPEGLVDAHWNNALDGAWSHDHPCGGAAHTAEGITLLGGVKVPKPILLGARE